MFNVTKTKSEAIVSTLARREGKLVVWLLGEWPVLEIPPGPQACRCEDLVFPKADLPRSATGLGDGARALGSLSFQLRRRSGRSGPGGRGGGAPPLTVTCSCCRRAPLPAVAEAPGGRGGGAPPLTVTCSCCRRAPLLAVAEARACAVRIPPLGCLEPLRATWRPYRGAGVGDSREPHDAGDWRPGTWAELGRGSAGGRAGRTLGPRSPTALVLDAASRSAPAGALS
ncbi:uncharacterized protein [Macaca fascicularis]|uniref:uncharacterized protein n=1 Tax=Macaca fascicularis TaxID=9541 RepID=UPI003D15A63A